MNERKEEIRQANRKALPKFLLFTLACALVGGVVGFLTAFWGLERLADTFAAAGAFFAGQIAPWLMLACVIARPAVCVPLYRKAKRQLTAWDGEDEEQSAAVDRTASIVQWINNLFSVLIYFLLGAVFSVTLVTQLKHTVGFALYTVTLVCFILCLVEGMMLERRIVDLARLLAPEKEGSVYELQFNKKWMDSCDELEKLRIGQCARKAYRAANTTCMVLWVIFLITGMFLNTGFLPVLAVCIIWGVSLSVYHYWALRLSRTGSAEL